MNFIINGLLYALVGVIALLRAVFTLVGFLVLFAIVMYVIIP